MAQAEDRVAQTAVDRRGEEGGPDPFDRQDALEAVARHQAAPVGVEAEGLVEALDRAIEKPAGEIVRREREVDRRVTRDPVMERQVQEAELAVHVIGVPAEGEDRVGVGLCERPALTARLEVPLYVVAHHIGVAVRQVGLDRP